MVAAGVTALSLHIRNREILLDQSLVELGKLRVCEVCDDADFLLGSPLDPSGHIELAHGDNFDTTGLVVSGNGLGAQEATLLNVVFSSACNCNKGGEHTSAEYQWNSTVRLGLKSDSNKAL